MFNDMQGADPGYVVEWSHPTPLAVCYMLSELSEITGTSAQLLPQHYICCKLSDWSPCFHKALEPTPAAHPLFSLAAELSREEVGGEERTALVL